MTHALAFHDVHRRFGREEILRGLSLSVEPGQVYALLGRNGSGKTTAIRILLGFLEPMAGSSSILGFESKTLPPAARDRIGYVSEGHRLYGTLKVKDAVAFEAGTRPRFRKDKAKAMIARCGLPMGKFILRLSRGQRAQLALILAVASDPEVLVFDDPAMGLDVAMRREFLDVMIDLLSERGSAVLLSSHILTDVERMADRVGILHGGRLVADAPLETLKGRLRKVHWEGGAEGAAEAPPTEAPGLVRAVRAQGGFDLTLLDLDNAGMEGLREGGARVSEPQALSLEEIFLELTADGEGGGGAARDLLAGDGGLVIGGGADPGEGTRHTADDVTVGTADPKHPADAGEEAGR